MTIPKVTERNAVSAVPTATNNIELDNVGQPAMFTHCRSHARIHDKRLKAAIIDAVIETWRHTTEE